MKNKKWLIVMGLMLMPVFALADGMVIPPIDRDITETGQKAVIFYEDGSEDLILSIGFKGTAEKFSWIVPTPNKPEIKKGNEKTFSELEKYTQPKETLLNRFINWILKNDSNYGSSDGVIPMESLNVGPTETTKPKVEVVAEKQVGVFDTVTLKAENSDDLIKWLEENGFQTGTIATNKVIQEYIDNNWYFVAMKINNDYQTEKISNDLNNAEIAPIILSFKTDKMIYPLKISSLDFGALAKPKGNWGRTCRNDKIEGNMLSAECQKISSEWVQTTINWEECKTDIQNINGKLTCDRYYPYRSDDYQDIHLYVFSDKKYDADNYRGYQKYAEKLSSKKTNSFFGQTIKKSKSYFMTKIEIYSLEQDQMNKDLLFKESGDNKEINTGAMTINEKFQLIFLAILVLLYFPITLLVSKAAGAALLVGVIYLIIYIISIVRSIKNPDKNKLLRTILQTYLMGPAVFALSLVLIGFYEMTSSSYYYADYIDTDQALWIIIIGAVISLVISYIISRFFHRYAVKKNKLNRILAIYGDEIDNE